MSSVNITIHPEDASQVEAIKAFMKALKIKFEVNKDPHYNAEFIKKIEKSKQEFEEGKSTRIKKEDLQDFLGL